MANQEGPNRRVTPDELHDYLSDLIDRINANNRIVRLDFHANVQCVKPNARINSWDVFGLTVRNMSIMLSPDATIEQMENTLNMYFDMVQGAEGSEHARDVIEGSGMSLTGVINFYEFTETDMREAEEADEDDLDDRDGVEELDEENEMRADYNPRRKPNDRTKCTSSKTFWEIVYRARTEKKTPGRWRDRNNWMARYPLVQAEYYNTITDVGGMAKLNENFGGAFTGFNWVFVDRFLMPLANVDYTQGRARPKSKFIQYDSAAGMWRYIYDITMLKIPANYNWCNKCVLFHHARERRCWKRSNVDYADEYRRFERTTARLVLYGDFESYDVLHDHKISGLSVQSSWLDDPDRQDEELILSMRDYPNEGEFGKHFLEYIDYNFLRDQYILNRIGRCSVCNSYGQTYVPSFSNIVGADNGAAYCEAHLDLDAVSIPIFFHNGTRYDMAHILTMIIPNLAPQTIREINTISKSVNRLETVNIRLDNGYILSFRDSLKHLTASVAQLAKTIPGQVIEKGDFPYEWFDDLNKLTLPELPPPGELWYSSLTGKTADGEEAHRIFNEKGFTTVQEYHDYYMSRDVEILRKAFTAHRHNMINKFGVDPSRYNGTPSVAITVCKKMMGVNENYWNSLPPANIKKEMYEVSYANIRGGITLACKRYQHKGEGQICYLDINSMYSSVMRYKKFPIGSTFQKIEGITIEQFMRDYVDNVEYGEDTEKGFFAIIDCEPSDAAMETYTIPPVEAPWGTGLNNTWEPIKSQMFQYNRIRQMLNHQYRITDVLTVYTYKHAACYQGAMEEFHTERAAAKARGDKGMDMSMKLSSNSSYGKTCERGDKYRDLKISPVTEGDAEFAEEIGLLNVTDSEGNPVRMTLVRPDSVEMKNAPWHGFSILEYSKEIFYSGQHTFLSAGAEILYCDTDSMILYSPDPNFYDRLLDEHSDIVCPSGDKTPMMWELEDHQDAILEVFAVSPKCYFLSYVDQERRPLDKHKGITNSTILTREQYYDAIFYQHIISVPQTTLRLDKDTIHFHMSQKIALQAKNGKRIVAQDGIHTYAIGDRRIMSRRDLGDEVQAEWRAAGANQY